MFVFQVLLACLLTEVTSRPSNNDSEVDEEPIKTPKAAIEDNSINYQIYTNKDKSHHTKEILDKLKFLNIDLGKPPRIVTNDNNPYESYDLINHILANSALTSGIMASNNEQLKDSHNDDEGRNYNSRSAKLLPNMFVPNSAIPSIPYPYIINVPAVPLSYYEILGGYNINNNLMSPSNQAIQSRQQLFPNFPSFPSFPSFSFDNIQLQPFAQFFPVLIKNPFVALAQGGGWNNFIEYGQNADVCNRKQKSIDIADENKSDVKSLVEKQSKLKNIINIESNDDDVKGDVESLVENQANDNILTNYENNDDNVKSLVEKQSNNKNVINNENNHDDVKSLVKNQSNERKVISNENNDDNVKSLVENQSNESKLINNESNDSKTSEPKTTSRQSRSIKKRTVSAKAPVQEVEEIETGKKIYPTKPSTTRKTTKRPLTVDQDEDFKNSDQEGDLRFPFSDFTWFGNKKPVAPSPGFFINKLKVRKGGVAIAGPGGVATAGRGGTAIVGPGGLAYTKPGGLAIAGPHARVVALSPYADTLPSIFRPHQLGYDFRSLDSIREGKVVATGPVIYYHPLE
ncbi:unnamed protein product [Euphydryas editha]|uniref:DUF4774 domain-containing protein n=1 Tax=Euphydryas editha TaxID=104508 RepID=A0AAU9VC18_EUPED|nr:unnamed protein product [Euphydryas editha]